MISARPAHPDTRARPEGAAVLVFPLRSATVPSGIRDLRGGGPLLSRGPILFPFGELPVLLVCRQTLEEEILALWEG